jgi:hypothetical protein
MRRRTNKQPPRLDIMPHRRRSTHNPALPIFQHLLHTIAHLPLLHIHNLANPQDSARRILVHRIRQACQCSPKVWESSDVQIPTGVGGDVVERNSSADGLDVLQEVGGRECVDADVAVDAAGHVDEVVEAAGEAVGEFELGLGDEGESLGEILLVQRHGVLDIGGYFFVRLVAADSGVAFAVDVAECYIAAAGDGF